MGSNRHRLPGQEYDTSGAMTFDEIARHLGISRSLAWVTYCRAIRKLRRKKHAMRELRDLARARDCT
jgi:hypothetical protein